LPIVNTIATMVIKLSEKEAKNRENIAKAIARLQDGSYTNPYQASKATEAPIRYHGPQDDVLCSLKLIGPN
jgi:hypothetical protein